MSSPHPEKILFNISSIPLGCFLLFLILITIFGNTLIIAAVATTRRLRTITNYFVVSLAVSDLLVGILVMPFAVIRELTKGVWLFGRTACELWVSLDVMLCTASILNLCCISLDRYFAITRPLAYAVNRSERLAVTMIGLAWIASALITCPPLFGWNNRPQNETECVYTKNEGYVIYSALGSFYIPAFIMLYVYWRIFAVARKRQAVLMQGNKCDLNKEVVYGSYSNSSTAGETAMLNNLDHQNILKDTMDISDEKVPRMSEVRGGSTNRNSSCRKSAFSVMHSTTCFFSCQHSYNPSMQTELYHQHNNDGDDLIHQQSTVDKPGGSRRISRIEENESASPTEQYCQHCNTKKEVKTTKLGIRKKDSYERTAFQRERKVAKSLSVVVGGFIVCWLPFFIVYLIEPFCESCVFHPKLRAFLVWLGWVNSAINPFIYAMNNEDFKKAFIRLTIDKCCCCRKQKRNHESATVQIR